MTKPETPSTGVSVVIGTQAETSYVIHVQGRRLWTERPVPLGQLDALSKFAAAVIGVPAAKAVVDAKIGERLGASFAMCARADADAWLAELDAAGVGRG